MDVEVILRRVADNNNITVDVVKTEIGKALRDGKRSPAFREAFGDRESTVDEYVEKLTDVIMNPHRGGMAEKNLYHFSQ